MSEWVAAIATAAAAVISLAALIWARLDIRRERRGREALELRVSALATHVERIAAGVGARGQTAVAAAELEARRRADRWRLNEVDRGEGRVVYALTNVGTDPAHGVSVSAPNYPGATLLVGLPKQQTMPPDTPVRFYLTLRAAVPLLTSVHVRWDGGNSEVAVVDSGRD